jgi:hypothetical protein
MDACVSKCVGAGSTCAVEETALFKCLVAAGPAALECDQPIQSVVLKEGYCVMENGALVACVSK